MILSSLRRTIYKPDIYTNTNSLHHRDKDMLYKLNRTQSFVCLYIHPTGIIPIFNRRFSIHTDGLLIRSSRLDEGIFTSFEEVEDIVKESSAVVIKRKSDKNLRIQLDSSTPSNTFCTLLQKSYKKYIRD